MALTIKNKLIFIGLLAIIALSASSYLSYVSGQKLNTMSAMSAVSQTNAVLAQRVILHRQEILQHIYIAALHRASNQISQVDSDAIKENSEKLVSYEGRLVKRELGYVKAEDMQKAHDLAKELDVLVQVQFPEMIVKNASDREFLHFIDTVTQKSDELGVIQASVSQAVFDEMNRVADDMVTIINASNQQIIIVLGVALALMIPLLTLTILSITRPIKKMTTAMSDLASGDMAAEIPSVGKKDEIGGMAQAVVVFKQNMVETENLKLEQEKQKERNEEEKRAAMHQMADSFEASVSGIVSQVASSASQMKAGAQSVNEIAENTKQRSNTVVNISTEVAQTSSQVASAAEELTSSIKEISAQTQKSSNIYPLQLKS
ncbi:MAG: HAMP domain-containing protein [Alphaproteobacteria bacterium]|nr:HAMP domain-containing protein [Alphaproteobacteria bacterium]